MAQDDKDKIERERRNVEDDLKKQNDKLERKVTQLLRELEGAKNLTNGVTVDMDDDPEGMKLENHNLLQRVKELEQEVDRFDNDSNNNIISFICRI